MKSHRGSCRMQVVLIGSYRSVIREVSKERNLQASASIREASLCYQGSHPSRMATVECSLSNIAHRNSFMTKVSSSWENKWILTAEYHSTEFNSALCLPSSHLTQSVTVKQWDTRCAIKSRWSLGETLLIFWSLACDAFRSNSKTFFRRMTLKKS